LRNPLQGSSSYWDRLIDRGGRAKIKTKWIIGTHSYFSDEGTISWRLVGFSIKKRHMFEIMGLVKINMSPQKKPSQGFIRTSCCQGVVKTRIKVELRWKTRGKNDKKTSTVASNQIAHSSEF